MNRARALLTFAIALMPGAFAGAQRPPVGITTAHATVTVKGRILNGAFTYDRVGALTMWGPGGGLIDIDSTRGDALQYSALPKAGSYKTTASMPLVVQVGVGPTVKVVTSAAGECTVTVTRADETGVAASFECGRIEVLGPEKKMLGPIDSMTGSFTASR